MVSIENDYKIEMLENGLDFISNSLNYIKKKEKSKYNIKYSILHISAGLELILKYKLLKLTNWEQMFNKVKEADEGLYNSGDFISVNFRECIKRLEKFNISFSANDMDLLKAIKEKRNKIEHFGISDSYESLVSFTSKLLNFIINFISDNFDNSKFNEIEKELLDGIRSQLNAFEEFVRHRMDEINVSVENYKKSTGVLTCPSCLQDALITDDGTKCLFCGYSDHSYRIARRYVDEISYDYRSAKDGEEYPLYECPECNEITFITDKASGSWKCFNCTFICNNDEIDRCTRCGDPIKSSCYEYKMQMCDNCLEYWLDNY